MLYSPTWREEELKNHVAADFFADYDCARIVGNIDFCVSVPDPDPRTGDLWERESLLWAEAKRGQKSSLTESFVQLILTIGRARTFDKALPPAFLGAFDAAKIAFIPYSSVLDVFYQNDFNWFVTPSDHATKEFAQLQAMAEKSIREAECVFEFERDEKELREFIRRNFHTGNGAVAGLRITRNNFASVYLKWLDLVKPTIAIDWEAAKRVEILDADFYLADLLSEHNITLREKLYVLLRNNHYELCRALDKAGFFHSAQAEFRDEQRAHREFWNRYKRPPKREYWEYMVERRDLLVPQDVRERKGSFFTPRGCVEKSQEALEMVLGETWQDEYTIWDCAAGTGNLLVGLTDKYRIWASTIDQADVDAMKDRIQNGANLLESHVFKFDFLNDGFEALPEGLREIVANPEKRRKLVIYINPPYAETATRRLTDPERLNKRGVSFSQIRQRYAGKIGIATKELFAQFLIRVDQEIPGAILANFSTLKHLQGPNFIKFRQVFQPELKSLFLFPADIFDNVHGKFPIGFFVWDTGSRRPFQEILADVYNRKVEWQERRRIVNYDGRRYGNEWVIESRELPGTLRLGYLSCKGNDFQNNNFIYIVNRKEQLPNPRGSFVTDGNLHIVAVYFAIRHVIEHTWLNDRDQFLYPNDGWESDREFQADCLAYTLFHLQNYISFGQGINHWIPFTEAEVGARDNFASHFMSEFLAGKRSPEAGGEELPGLGAAARTPGEAVRFSPEAQAVLDSGRELFRLHHRQDAINVNASFYDIRRHFQGIDANGRMNAAGADPEYNAGVARLREAMKRLEERIAPKVYRYGFLLE